MSTAASRPGGGRHSNAPTRAASSEKAGASKDPSAAEHPAKAGQSSSKARIATDASAKSTKPVKFVGGGRHSVSRTTRSNAEKLRALQAAEAAMSVKGPARQAGGGRRAMAVPGESKRTKLKAIESKFAPSGNRRTKTIASSRASIRSVSSLSNNRAHQASSVPEALPTHNKLDAPSTIRSLYDPSKQPRSKPSLSSMSSFTAFVPSSLARAPNMNAVSTDTSGEIAPHSIALSSTSYLLHVNTHPAKGEGEGRLGRPECVSHLDIDDDDDGKDDASQDSASDDETPPMSPSHIPVTVSITTSSTMIVSPKDTVAGLMVAAHHDTRDHKYDLNAILRKNLLPDFATRLYSERTAFATYGARADGSFDDDGEDGWENGDQLIRRERRQGWVGEWIIQGKNAGDMQEVITQLRALK